MISLIRKVIRHCATDADNVTFDTRRVTGMVAVRSLIRLQSFHTLHTGVFDPSAFRTGIAAVLRSVGVYLFGQGKTTPPVDTPPPSGGTNG